MSVFFTILALVLSIFTNTKDVNIISGFIFLKYVIIYVIALELLKMSLSSKNSKFLDIKFDSHKYTYSETIVISLLSAFPFGLGVSSILKGLSKNSINTLPISQGMTMSMFIYPTTLASGYVLDYYKLSSILYIFIYGLPIVFAIVFVFKNISFAKLAKDKLVVSILKIGTINVIYIAGMSILIDGNFLLKQSFFFIALSIINNKSILLYSLKAIYNVKDQVIFFLGSGIFGKVITSVISNTDPSTFQSLENLNLYILILIPIVVIPIFSIMLVHPLVLFIMFAPILSSSLNIFSDLSIYVIWITMLINSQLLSPVSITTVLASKNTNTNIFTESFIKHYKFCTTISFTVILYLLFTHTIINVGAR